MGFDIYQIDRHNATTRVLLKNRKVMELQELLPEHWISDEE